MVDEQGLYDDHMSRLHLNLEKLMPTYIEREKEERDYLTAQ